MQYGNFWLDVEMITIDGETSEVRAFYKNTTVGAVPKIGASVSVDVV